MIRRVLLSLWWILLIASGVSAQTEHLVVTTPVVDAVTILDVTTITPCRFAIDRRAVVGFETIEIRFCEADGSGSIIVDGWMSPRYVYGPNGLTSLGSPSESPQCVNDTTPTGQAILVGLNTMDGGARSLRQRIMDRLAADCPALDGTVVGDP